MSHEITDTTDGQFIGLLINIADRPIVLQSGEQIVEFTPDVVQTIEVGLVRLANANYIIEAKDTTNA